VQVLWFESRYVSHYRVVKSYEYELGALVTTRSQRPIGYSQSGASFLTVIFSYFVRRFVPSLYGIIRCLSFMGFKGGSLS